MSTLSRDDILNFDAGEPIEVEAFGGIVHVRPLSGTERDRYEMQNLKQTRGGTTKLDLTNARARLVQLSLVEKAEDGTWRRMFAPDHVKQLGRLPAAELDKVAEVAREASGLSELDEEETVESFDEDEAELVGASSS